MPEIVSGANCIATVRVVDAHNIDRPSCNCCRAHPCCRPIAFVKRSWARWVLPRLPSGSPCKAFAARAKQQRKISGTFLLAKNGLIRIRTHNSQKCRLMNSPILVGGAIEIRSTHEGAQSRNKLHTFVTNHVSVPGVHPLQNPSQDLL